MAYIIMLMLRTVYEDLFTGMVPLPDLRGGDDLMTFDGCVYVDKNNTPRSK